MTDIQIARKANLKNILEITRKLNIDDKYINQYGNNKAKISYNLYSNISNNKNGKLILVTSINPTPMGEGKTTVSIGLADAIKKINKNVILTLREPSLGPVFGLKGGATGGGYAQVAPMEEINLHFTGDIHAITSANNLLSAMIDNHIYFGNKLKFKEVVWKRCLDLNDRALRKIEINLDEGKRYVPRIDRFDISVASEIMAILCLATDINDLKSRLANIIVGYNDIENPIYAKDLKAEGAMLVLLKDAFNPNIVQTLENTPAIIHGGPFANIAHGCNSIVATKMALKLSDYVVTEAGFGADLGAEKFLDIKCRIAKIKPDVAVCVATIKALKYHGGMEKDNLKDESLEYLNIGINNLLKHVDNLKNKFNLNVIVAINKFNTDTENEINFLIKKLNDFNIDTSIVEAWEKGSNGAIDLAEKVIKKCDKQSDLNYIYDLNEDIYTKIDKIAKKIYGAEGVKFSEESKKNIEKINALGYSNLPICIAKTQYSFSDDPKNLKCDKPFEIHIKNIMLKSGAKFIVALAGNIYTMPGLPEHPAVESIGLDENNNIFGIF